MRGMSGVLMVLMLTVVGAGAQSTAANARTDFSGTWVFDQVRSAQPGPDGKVSLAAMLGDEFTAKQDAALLSLAIKAGGVRVNAAYKLDGTDSKNVSPGAFGQPAVDVVSRASWDKDRLVIVSKSVSVVSGKDVAVETRRVMWIDKGGSLVMERTGTSASQVAPTRSVYRKAK